jgi:hypothetical protein
MWPKHIVCSYSISWIFGPLGTVRAFDAQGCSHEQENCSGQSFREDLSCENECGGVRISTRAGVRIYAHLLRSSLRIRSKSDACCPGVPPNVPILDADHLPLKINSSLSLSPSLPPSLPPTPFSLRRAASWCTRPTWPASPWSGAISTRSPWAASRSASSGPYARQAAL